MINSIVKSACGQTTAQSDTYFQNPGWPDASVDRLICTLTVELQEDVAQLRLDFVKFEVSMMKNVTNFDGVKYLLYVLRRKIVYFF